MNTIKKVSKQTLTSLTSYNELSLFCGPITVTLTDGGDEGSQTPVLGKNRRAFYILSILLISCGNCLYTDYFRRILLSAAILPQSKQKRRSPS